MKWKMSDLTNKDAEQDTRIAVIDSTLENAVRRIEMVHSRIDKTEEKLKELDNELRGRIRKLEIWVGGAAAVIAAATFIIGIVASAESQEVNHGSNDTPKQEKLL